MSGRKQFRRPIAELHDFAESRHHDWSAESSRACISAPWPECSDQHEDRYDRCGRETKASLRVSRGSSQRLRPQGARPAGIHGNHSLGGYLRSRRMETQGESKPRKSPSR
jgi:hypothetical protein